MKDIKLTIKILEELTRRSKYYSSKLCSAGICVALRKGGSKYELMQHKRTLERWEHFSGNVVFPIPTTGTRYSSPAAQYIIQKNLWLGKQGELRRDLAAHLIRVLTTELKYRSGE